MRTRRAFKMKQKAFFNNFQELSVAKSCLRPATAFSISAIKRGLFIKSFLLNIVARVWNFQLLLICKSSKLSSYSLLKNMSKIPSSNLNKRSPFFKFYLIFKLSPFYYHKLVNLIFFNLLHFEMNFGNLYYKFS